MHTGFAFFPPILAFTTCHLLNPLVFLLHKHVWSSFRPLWWGRPELNTTWLHVEGEFLTQPTEKWPTSWNSWRIPRLFCNVTSGYKCLRYESNSILNISSTTNNCILSTSLTYVGHFITVYRVMRITIAGMWTIKASDNRHLLWSICGLLRSISQ